MPLLNLKSLQLTSDWRAYDDGDDDGGDGVDDGDDDGDIDGDDGQYLQGLPRLRWQGGDEEEGDEGRVEERRHVLQVPR